MEKTTDYSIFKRIPGNRPISISHVDCLSQAIQQKNLLSARPILVNERMEIIDGQHRLEAAKYLNIPIYYEVIPNLTINDVASLNSYQKNWKMEYFIYLYCEAVKNPEYIKFKSWLEKNDFSITQGISFFIDEANVGEFREKFKNGEFIFNENMDRIADTYRIFLSKAETYSRGSGRHWKNQVVVRAFAMFLSNKEIQESRFFEQLDKYSFMLTKRFKKQDIIDMFYEIYNYKRHIRVENDY